MQVSEIATVNIEVGKTDGFRYIGFQPPLTEGQKQVIAGTIQEGASYSSYRPSGQGEVYGCIGFATSYDEVVLGWAQKVVEELRAEGYPVHFNDSVQEIGAGYHLFGGIDDPCV